MRLFRYNLCFFLVVVVFSIESQSAPQDYYLHLRKADSLYKIQSYYPSALEYNKAFYAFEKRGFSSNRYCAAKAWAMAGFPDTAFSELFHIVKYGADIYSSLISEAVFKSMRKDPKWKELLTKATMNRQGGNAPLSYEITTMSQEDTHWLNLILRFENGSIARDSISLTLLRSRFDSINELHYLRIRQIVKIHGFPNFSLVGYSGMQGAWLLIQHQDKYPGFQKEALRLLKKELRRNEADSRQYAYLVDRVHINTGKKQIYGTQTRLKPDSSSFEVEPTRAPRKLNKRRKAVGLEPLEEYIQKLNHINAGILRK